MLVLSRYVGESIIIDTRNIPADAGTIEVVVVRTQGNKIKLGIHAHSAIPVHRKEVFETIQREQEDKINGGN